MYYVTDNGKTPEMYTYSVQQCLTKQIYVVYLVTLNETHYALMGHGD